MKLIKCYIENFGGLSEYELNFNEGLTVIKEDNGFGKTTLAEFIRAMFYGLPRNNKDPEKSNRSKYLPWQGGSYGGYLDFEHEGTVYRISRRFGQSQKQDKFKLYEGENLSPGSRFSENIGQELFGLDEAAFQRSSYMPQLQSPGPLTSAGIQAKLSNLVEDSGDIGNFDKAMELLRKKRSSYRNFRGEGGSIGKLQEEISVLQNKLDSGASVQKELNELRIHSFDLKNQRQLKENELDKLRKEITENAEAKAVLTIRAQHQDLLQERDREKQRNQALRENLPQNMPELSEISELLPLYDRLSSIKAGSEAEDSGRAREIQAMHREKFKNGLPDEAEIREFEKKNQELISLKGSASNLCLSKTEAMEERELSEFFKNGLPDEDFIDACREENRILGDLELKASGCAVDEDERKRLSELEEFFKDSVPQKQELEDKKQLLIKLRQLKAEKLSLQASAVQERTEKKPEKNKKSLFLPLMILGILLMAAGAVLMGMKQFLPGGILLGLGAAALLSGREMRIKQMIKQEISSAKGPELSDYDRERLIKVQEEIQKLDRELSGFCRKFILSEADYGEQLTEISIKLSMYKPLKLKLSETQREKAELDRESFELRQRLSQKLSAYFPEPRDFSQAIGELSRKLSELKSLNNKKAELKKRAEEMEISLEELKNELVKFLYAYYPEGENQSFTELLSSLSKDRAAYLGALKQLEDAGERLARREKEKTEILSEIRKFSEKYELFLDESSKKTLEELRDRLKDYMSSSEILLEKEEKLREFEKEKAGSLGLEDEIKIQDGESLKAREKALSLEISDLDREILKEKSRLSALQQQADLLPQMSDKLSELREDKEQQNESCRLLDLTMDYLQEAKEAINSSYLGPVKKSFSYYLGLLSGENQENVVLDSELSVKLQRRGEARELPYFSAGQKDMVMLCMRLALTDALFGDEKPFIILDDPFVNLDDSHTAEALELLKKLENRMQIIYLVCNSARAI